MIIERKQSEQTGKIVLRNIGAPINGFLVDYFRHRARVDHELRYFEVIEADYKENADKIKVALKCEDVRKEFLERLGVRELDYYGNGGGLA